jgi:subtilisin-like proprotein convertase family protein
MRTLTFLVIFVCAIGLISSGASAAIDEKVYKWQGVTSIPDNDPNGARVEIFVPDDPDGKNIIQSLVVSILIQHTWQGDLLIILEQKVPSRSAIELRLMDRPGTEAGVSTFGYLADNLGNIETGDKFYFDDRADSTYDVPHVDRPGIESVTGFWRPEQELRAFTGKDKRGLWSLTVIDQAGGDTGFIRNVGLHFVNVPEPGTLALLGFGGLMMIRRRLR